MTVGSTPSPRCHNSWSPICRPHVEGHLLRSPNVLSLLLSLSQAAGTTAGNWGINLRGSQLSSKIIFSFSDYFLVEDLPLSQACWNILSLSMRVTQTLVNLHSCALDWQLLCCGHSDPVCTQYLTLDDWGNTALFQSSAAGARFLEI